MTDYSLENLGPRTFEHLVQALATREITSAVVPFGDGPDGSREATFEGPTGYGASGSTWDGYGIIQAKFKQGPRAVNDGSWALKQLRDELLILRRRSRSRRNLDYYVFCTNVILTPAERSGSKDRATELLEQFAKAHGLKGFAIWDYDKIRTLLDNNAEVRRTYAAWITPGDVLYELAEYLRPVRADYYQIAVNFLQKELLADQYAKLEQAGHSGDDPIPLSQVFIDLPTTGSPITDSEANPAYMKKDEGFAGRILDVASHRYSKPVESADGKKRSAGRYVLIGGPGQGKTTLGQFVCQLFRTALLKDVDQNLIEFTAKQAIQQIVRDWEQAGQSMPTARRMPFRIVLSEYATALAEGTVAGLLDYLAYYVGRRTGGRFEAAHVRGFIAEYPFILILDGLDEVPPSTNRDELLATVRDFWVDVAGGMMDAVIIATSRPQGYNQDFSPETYVHRYLCPLDATIALRYGEKLTRIRFTGDETRIQKIVDRLQRAATTPATFRLMRSPLQVTIMTLLVDRTGQPPQERWSLFHDYYSLVYQRELERDIPAAMILRDHRIEIEAIHRRVGIVLQAQSEKSGGTDARLTRQQFREVVTNYLREEGHSENSVHALGSKIIDAAALRLVFLVGIEMDRVGFEIRSLQEFMAAEGIMDEEDSVVRSRLREIASAVHWRNVFLFAAGKCLSQRRYLHDTIESICVELNEASDDPVSRFVRAGSILALELLEDGPSARYPTMCRVLSRLAFQILENPDRRQYLGRFVDVYRSEAEEVFVSELERRLRDEGISGVETATRALTARLADVYGGRFAALAQGRGGYDIQNADACRDYLAVNDGQPGIVRSRISRAIPHLGPEDLLTATESNRPIWIGDDQPPWLDGVMAVILPRRIEAGVAFPVRGLGRRNICDVNVYGVDQARFPGAESLLQLTDCSPRWLLTHAVARFCVEPSRRSLEDAVERLSPSTLRTAMVMGDIMCPWPLALAFRAFRRGTDPLDYLDSLGLRGASEWREREASWIDQGISVEEFFRSGIGDVAHGLNIADVDGFPEIIRRVGDFVDGDIPPVVLWSIHEYFARYVIRQRGSRDYAESASSAASDAFRLLLASPYAFLGLELLNSVELPGSVDGRILSAVDPMALATYRELNEMGARQLYRLALQAWAADPSPKLLTAFAMCALGHPRVKMMTPDLPRDALESPELVLARLVLRLHDGESVEAAAEEMREIMTSIPWAARTLVGILQDRLSPPGRRAVDVAFLYSLMASEFTDLTVVHAVLTRMWSSRRSNLGVANVWRDLCLPSSLEPLVVGSPNSGG